MQGKGAGRRGGGERDVEEILDELYTTPPSDFVSRREELALAARTAGRAEDARRIHAARRPTLAAWAANLLLRSEPEESLRFLELGRSLREAYQTLDAAGLKELSAQRRRVVSALSRQAAQLARDAGHRLSGTVQEEVEATLRAVLAGQEAADRWAAGRLQSALTPPSGFPAEADTGTSPVERKPAQPPPARTLTKDELAERRRRRHEQLARAKEAAQAAKRRLREEQARLSDAEAALRRARDRQDQARQRVSAAEEQARQAREELRRTDREQREAEERHEEAAGALSRAEREARQAAEEVERLGGSRVR
ncbi:hypothetical protein [Streptomyces sp. S.PNR 29]|uniref:hypothetical protein n=1 Tax=Streptomyces sp. S.PNR 29 TaxID=2973805 RepID=UPI0025B11ED3|nr:hypothetical protein [Streptomyces sp. S.PNR 29]MDN0200578.1 hypothetical protein [Streptomyces sp. S.PNR 29]